MSRRYGALPLRSCPSGDRPPPIRRNAFRVVGRRPARRALPPGCRRSTAGAWSQSVQPPPAVVAGREYGVVSPRVEVVDFLVVQVSGGERGQQVGGAVGGLDQRDVSWRQRGRSVLGELLLGEGTRVSERMSSAGVRPFRAAACLTTAHSEWENRMVLGCRLAPWFRSGWVPVAGQGCCSVVAGPGQVAVSDGRSPGRRLLPATVTLPAWGLEAVTVPGNGPRWCRASAAMRYPPSGARSRAWWTSATAAAHRTAETEAPDIVPKGRRQTIRLARVAPAVQRPAAARAARRLGRVDLRQKIPDPGVREGGVTEQVVRHWGVLVDVAITETSPPETFLQDRRGAPPRKTSTNPSRSAPNHR